MLKLRAQGTKESLESFKDFLMSKQDRYEVMSISDMYKNKGTAQHFRMYADVIETGKLCMEEEKEEEIYGSK